MANKYNKEWKYGGDFKCLNTVCDGMKPETVSQQTLKLYKKTFHLCLNVHNVNGCIMLVFMTIIKNYLIKVYQKYTKV